MNIFLLYKHVFFHLVKIHALFAYLYDRLCELRGSIGLVFFVRGACAAPRIFARTVYGGTVLNELFWWILAGGLLVVLWYLLEVYLPYRDRATDIKMEIERSLNACERRFWQKKLRRLRLKLIPIVRLFVRP